MSIFGSLFGSKAKTSDADVAALIASMADPVMRSEYEVMTYIASLIDRVIVDAGINVLLAGSLTMNNKFLVRFEVGQAKQGATDLTTIEINSVEGADMLKSFARIDCRDVSLLAPAVDAIACDSVRKFSSSCSTFAALPKLSGNDSYFPTEFR